MLFAPQINVIFGISTSNNAGKAKFIHETGGVLLLQIYRSLTWLGSSLLFGQARNMSW